MLLMLSFTLGSTSRLSKKQANDMIISRACGIFNPLLLACFAQHIGAISRAVYV